MYNLKSSKPCPLPSKTNPTPILEPSPYPHFWERSSFAPFDLIADHLSYHVQQENRSQRQIMHNEIFVPVGIRRFLDPQSIRQNIIERQVKEGEYQPQHDQFMKFAQNPSSFGSPPHFKGMRFNPRFSPSRYIDETD